MYETARDRANHLWVFPASETLRLEGIADGSVRLLALHSLSLTASPTLFQI